MIDRGAALALSTQARLLGVARSTIYRASRPVPASDLAIMPRIDELHLDYPFRGQPDDALDAGERRGRDRADARSDADAPDGH